MLGHNLDLNIMTPINSFPFKSCLLLQHVSHKHQTTSHFRAYSALSKTPTGHCGTKCAFLLLTTDQGVHIILDSTHAHTINYSLSHTSQITPTSTSFACTTCHMHPLSSHPTTHYRQCTSQDTWGYTYRPSTHSPCHGELGPSGTLQLHTPPHQHGRTQLHSGSCCIHHHQSCGAVTPFWGPGSGWCWHGHPLQLGAGHSLHSTKRNE